MFEFKYVLKLYISLIQFLQEKRREFFILSWFYKGKSWNFSKSIPKLRVFSEEIVNLDCLLAAANLNRY